MGSASRGRRGGAGGAYFAAFSGRGDHGPVAFRAGARIGHEDAGCVVMLEPVRTVRRI